MTNHKLYIQDETVDVTLILFKNVTNSKDVLEIYNKLSADISSSDHQNKFFLILDSQLVFNEDHILHSIYRGYHNFKTKKKITKNIILEIFFLLSSHENINECINQYKMNENSTSIIYVGVNMPTDQILEVTKLIQGESTNFDEISSLHCEKKILEHFNTDINNIDRFIYHNIASKKISLN
ncbi:EKC/KEOPS complex subunit CGI121, putative [Plasmodium yoelii]|uniref:EKC/KEOPS complex subunit CGI121 n=3 Tax=Plasmodium yoelii TaxID=5861 RepID=A0AAF0B6Q1_PLAYO|nr:EKC/KEOPS complex subunit CGI121, putative [Plasmodium yoelii]WBY58500.1 EKC/KEOPS complex subunit CGI121 [Plasmodium yoelii yoelii]CDU18816.1 kinase binding protein CGI-121, putative [Plasmodium yoelii]VTZ79401.1 EKC/KEOPS complex subunit CGI121, putative [Plasmodium yoelii]|eukprot:XP_022812370.1 EKC/KEOPS complex subunit CGI121, putative [Plasmodium yoelii]